MNENALTRRDETGITPMQDASREVHIIPGLDQEHHFAMRKLGNIHLGIKVKTANGKEYPKATEYFVLPELLASDEDFKDKLASMGEDPEKPTRLPIMLMSDNIGVNIVSSFDCYGMGGKLKCRSYDGHVCTRLNEQTCKYDTLPCTYEACAAFKKGDCARYHRLRFLLPDAAELGYWQIATKSDNNRGALVREIMDLRKFLRGHVAGADLILQLTNERTFHVPVTDRQGATKMIATSPYLMHLSLGRSLRKLMAETSTYQAVDEETIEESYDLDEVIMPDDGSFDVGDPEGAVIDAEPVSDAQSEEDALRARISDAVGGNRQLISDLSKQLFNKTMGLAGMNLDQLIAMNDKLTEQAQAVDPAEASLFAEAEKHAR